MFFFFKRKPKKAINVLQRQRTYAVTLENMQHVINKSCRTGLLQGESHSANFLMLFTKSNRHSAAHLFLLPLTSRQPFSEAREIITGPVY